MANPAKIPMGSKAPSRPQITGRRRIQARRSPVHGRGVFAMLPIARGTRIIEYTGQVISWEQAQRRHPHDPAQPNHTFYFHIDDQHVIDALHGGNSSRWINHSCSPNCEAEQVDGRIFITALRDIVAGEELNYDYGLVVDGPLTRALKAEYPCHCGSRDCRGTLLASTLGGAGSRKRRGRAGGKRARARR